MKEKLLGNQFVKNNTIFFVGSVFVAFINYIYYPVVGRFLPVESFGEVQVLISFFLQLTVFLTVLGLVTTGVVVNEKDDRKSSVIVTELQKAALLVSLIAAISIVILSPVLQSLFKFQSSIPFMLIAVVFLVSLLLSFKSAFIRAKQDFFAASAQGVIGGVGKIIFSVVLILVGFSTSGAIAGLLLAQIVALYYASYAARKLGYVPGSEKGVRRRMYAIMPDLNVVKRFYVYVAFVFGVSLITTLMYSLDVAVVKYLFSAQEAGVYAGIATVARIIFFLTGSFAVVILSSAKLTATPSENYHVLVKSLMLTVTFGGAAALFFVLFPSFTVHLLFGSRYDEMVHLLPPLSIAMLLMSISNLLANYYIALKQYLVLLWVSIGFAITIGLITFYHETISQVVYSFLAGSVAICLLLLSWSTVRALPLIFSIMRKYR